MALGRSRFGEAVRRRVALVAGMALGATMVASLVSLVLPRVYRAETRLEFAGTEGLRGDAFAARAAEIAEQALSHDAFSEAAPALGLDKRFAELAGPARRARCEEALGEMRDRSSVAVHRDGDARATVVLTAGDSDPDAAAELARCLAATLERQAAAATTRAEEAVIAESAAAKDAAEAAAAAAGRERDEYHAAHAEFLGGAAAKLQALREQRKQLRDVTIAGLEQKKRDLDELLAGEKPVETVKTRQPDPARLAAVNESIASAYEDLRSLTVVEKKSGSDPAVVAQRTKLAALEETKKSLVANAPFVETTQPSEQYAKLTKVRADAQSQIDAANRQLRALADAEKEQEELARRTPEFESKQKELDEAAAAADAAVARLAATLAGAEKALAAKKARGVLAVRVLEAPRTPTSPSGPGAVVLALAGLLAGALAGAGAAVVSDTMDHSFRDADSAARFLGVPVLCEVETIETPSEAASRRASARRRTVKLAALAAAATAFAATAAYAGTGGLTELLHSVAG